MNGEQSFRPMELLCGAAVLLALALGSFLSFTPPSKSGPPPVRVSFRHSQIPGKGLVAGINNSSEIESLKVVAVFVRGKGEPEERSYRLDRTVKPLDSLSVGWVELGGWKLKAGDSLRIRCEGYPDDLECKVAN